MKFQKARINLDKLSAPVRALVVSAQVNCVSGDIVQITKSGRYQLVFNHNNNGDIVGSEWWLDLEQIEFVCPV